MSLLPCYTHIINPKLKHIYLSFDKSGDLIIKSPKVSQKEIEKILLKKASWITKSRQRLQEKKGKVLDFSKESMLYFKGSPYPLKLVLYEKKRIKLSFDNVAFTLYYHTYDETLFQKHIDKFYKEQATAYIPQYVESWAKTMQLNFNQLTFRKTKRQWGSCSTKNNLSFNTMVMKLPESVIQYIIVHELSHIKYKHHQKTFWEYVAQYMPEYKTQVKELKNYTT